MVKYFLSWAPYMEIWTWIRCPRLFPQIVHSLKIEIGIVRNELWIDTKATKDSNSNP